MSNDEDNIRIDPRLIRIGLLALDAIANKYDIPFFDLDMDEKRRFLMDHGNEVVEAAKLGAGSLSRYFEDRVVMLIEGNGAGGLYFVKKKK